MDPSKLAAVIANDIAEVTGDHLDFLDSIGVDKEVAVKATFIGIEYALASWLFQGSKEAAIELHDELQPIIKRIGEKHCPAKPCDEGEE